MATVFDGQGRAYDATQVTQATVVNGTTIPAGWWIITDSYGRRSPCSPDSFQTMFSGAQGSLNIGTPGGAAGLNSSSQVIQHSAVEGQPGGVATLDANSHVIQHSAVEGQPGGVATLDANSHVIQTPAIGIRQRQVFTQVGDAAMLIDNVTSAYTVAAPGWNPNPAGNTPIISIAANSRIYFRLDGSVIEDSPSSGHDVLILSVTIGGTTYGLGSVFGLGYPNGYEQVSRAITTPPLAGGSYTAQILYFAGGASQWSCRVSQYGTMTVTLEEYV